MMSSAFPASQASDLPLENSQYLDDELSIGIAAEALLACHARGMADCADQRAAFESVVDLLIRETADQVS